MERTSIKFTHAALDEDGSEIVLRGVVDPSSLAMLKTAEYQREILPDNRIKLLMQALQTGGVPDIQLGCRGGNWRQGTDAGTFYIADDVYIIDGLQRCTAALRLLDKGIMPRIGAMVSFNTNEEIERKRFRALNLTRVKLSPNVILRNLRHESEAIKAINQLCLMSQFVLYRRVCWQQRMKREELITAMMLLQTTAYLHSRFGVGLTERSIPRIVSGLDRLFVKVGRAALIANTREFWNVMNTAFNIQDVAYRDATVAIRSGFLLAMARMLSSYKDFWRDTEFSVPTELQKKLKSFPVHDPSVQAYAISSGRGGVILANLIADHLNSGKRTKRLTPFEALPPQISTARDDDEDLAVAS